LIPVVGPLSRISTALPLKLLLPSSGPDFEPSQSVTYRFEA
jgi:hypothetical protein